jgi:two-component system chemotaxis response regulator CheB
MYKAVVIGTSFGGLEALQTILPEFPKEFPLAILVVLHIGEHSNDSFIQHLNRICHMKVKEAEDKEAIRPGTIYFAPPNYHLMVNEDFTCSLSTDLKINYSRPAIDVLFETAAWTYKTTLIGAILCGLNSDGAKGLLEVKKMGGYTMVENPKTYSASIMPNEAFKLAKPHIRLQQEKIAAKILDLLQ